MSSIASEPGPLLLRASLHETIWGGRNLSAIAGKALPDEAKIGESWETAVESVVTSGPHAGKTLGEVTAQFDERLLGWRAIEIFGHRFPLLTKFIDAQQWLSVQVHPDDVYAAEHEQGKLGKTETWYILHAEPGAQIVYGMAQETTRSEVKEAIAEKRLEALLQTVDVKAGDIVFVPAGTVHAIGAGVALYELQEYSDVTYRLYDYGRLQADGRARELHVEKSLDVMFHGPSGTPGVIPAAIPSGQNGVERRILVACDYFVEEELRLSGEMAAKTSGASCEILSTLGGNATLSVGEMTIHLHHGDTVVLPANLGSYRIESNALWLVRSYVPTPDDESLRLWKAAQSSAESGPGQR